MVLNTVVLAIVVVVAAVEIQFLDNRCCLRTVQHWRKRPVK